MIKMKSTHVRKQRAIRKIDPLDIKMLVAD